VKSPNTNGKKTDGRGAGGKFAPGNKASPGRPPGRGAVAEMREALAADLGGIIDTVKARALAGDMQAARIILDRLVPSLKPVEMPAEPVAASYLNLGNLCSLRLAFLR